MSDSFRDRSSAIEAEAGVTGYVHAVDIDTGADCGNRSDELVVAASIFKLPVLIEVCRRIADGSLSATQSVHIAGDFMRTDGDAGLSVMRDDISVSLRDLAYLMMSVSDNRATDILMRMVGIDAINATTCGFGLSKTVLVADCAGLFQSMLDETGVPVGDPAWAHPGEALRERLQSMSVVTPEATNRTTPRETTQLLSAIWRNQVLRPEACAEVRRILGLQVWPHRLRSGFPDSRITVSGKTGTLTYVRNEAGVVEYPDGGRYAVAVFLREASEEPRNPRADAAIGQLGRAAVDQLRGES
ncbi:class A beta-lactamase-related serine hydrolase [Saxibacter everestensis]|uniref:Class A beta-lactamase-related serine hydrolase n=1 Tax=Saxibacter everestensis TaxID=2909229 RepID=A0ABY8QTU4_9MICO|nr:class A beta-lactamase-related serine hydrolase [Brevibacteriaceae bacterium ZFBP1038]